MQREHRSMRERFTSLRNGFCLALVVAACTTVGLNTGGTATNFDLILRSNSDDTKNHAPNTSFSVSAKCIAGQQLVGGGYFLVNNGAEPTSVAVEGDYPSAIDTWTVQVRNPDNPAVYSGDADVVVFASAYCVTTTGYDLSMEIAKTNTTIPKTAGTSTDIDVRCSQTGALALAGGFLTTSLPTFVEPGGAVHEAFWPGLQGSGITTAGPRFPDASHSAMGWHVAQQYTPALNLNAPQVAVTTTVYALCAGKNINGQAYRLASTSGAMSALSSSLNPQCQTGEFSVGGGYDGMVLIGAPEVDGSLAVHSPFSFSGWKISGDSNGTSITANALCVRIPSI